MTDNKVERTELLSQTKSFNLECEKLKTTYENKLKELANFQNELQQLKAGSSKKENFQPAEPVKLENVIREAQVKPN